MDEEESKKRFTDCVYFLASPLTCKKGIECEYRHSEIARLNPRDCWYWLGGGCFNPDCAFRHPPLEGFTEAYCESADPANKKNIPCYFYSNGFCNKGDKCSFIHGPANASMVNNAVPPEKKLSAGSNTGSAPIESHPEPSETTQIEHAHTESKPTQDSQQLASRSTEKSESPDISATQLQENEFVQSESEVFTDHSSYEQPKRYLEREEWLESSPGFDVLVEGESERLGYQENADYFPVHDGKGRELDVHYVEYDCADPIEYDPVYPEMGNRERYDIYDHLDNKQSNDYLGKVNGQSRESIFYRLSFQKQDLRDRLKKRKVVGDSFRDCFYKPNFEHRIRRNPRRHDNRGDFRKAVHRQPPWSRKSTLQQKRTSREESATFTGPKTLDQIKEEKQKALQNGDLGTFDGFKGPRPLNEILKNKRKLGSAVDRDGNKN